MYGQGLLFYQSIWIFINAKCRYIKNLFHSDSDICPPISKIVLKNFIKISLIIKECPDEILMKLAIVLKISKSSWKTASKIIYCAQISLVPDNIYTIT
jgi:hypothetical protein